MNTAAPLISFVLPFYRKLEWLRTVFPRNACFQSSQVEVVLVLDEPSQEADVLAFVRTQPGRIRVIVNDEDHPWRPPCMALNVGLRHALGAYVVVLSPESYLLVEPGYLERRIQGDLPPGFLLTGQLWHGLEITPQHTLEQVRAYVDCHSPVSNIYGFYCCAKQQIIDAGGYDEARQRYGGDDDDLRHRLHVNGAVPVSDVNIRVLHPYHANAPRESDLPPEPWNITSRLDFTPFGHRYTRVAHDYAHVAQLAEPRASNANVAGSSPVVCSTV